ncbi:MAG: spore cortex biosynthesis protein YabQ [Clostridia bacterium]|nr:spore cortex biosynthesis protein YabQ [Clostridia bacterium]
MFVSSGQFYVLLSCIAFGVCCGVVRSIFTFFGAILNNKPIKIILDILFFVIIGFLFVLYSFRFSFPNVRAYMILGVFVGILLYMESFHIILAKFLERLYNKKVKSKK